MFIEDAFKACESLFSETVSPESGIELFSEVAVVFSAWRRLRSMRLSKEKWSEADFAANV